MSTDGIIHFSTPKKLTMEQVALMNRDLVYAFGNHVFAEFGEHVIFKCLGERKVLQAVYEGDPEFVYEINFGGYWYCLSGTTCEQWPIIYGIFLWCRAHKYVENIFYAMDSDYNFRIPRQKEMIVAWKDFEDREALL